MLILDASVIINILGTGDPGLILGRLPARAHVPRAVFNEVQREGLNGSSIAGLLEASHVSLLECTPEMIKLALNLAGALAPDDLDDGESYAIACAVVTGAMIAVDDRKARRILKTRWPHIKQHFSLDLIINASGAASAAQGQSSELVFQALKNSRMRVPRDRRAEVVRLIGSDRARECPSLGIL
jgi:predicted nucleic acid-binding protein